MLSDGIKIGEDLKAIQTEPLQPGQTPVPSGENAPEVIDIQLYVDYLCTDCAAFQQKNDEQLRSWVSSGAARTMFLRSVSRFASALPSFHRPGSVLRWSGEKTGGNALEAATANASGTSV